MKDKRLPVKIVGALVIAFLVAYFAEKALAAFPVDVRLTWTDPVQYEDGSVLVPDTDLVQYEVYCEKNQAEVFRQSWPKEVGVTTASFAGAFDGAGTYTCYLRTQAQNGGWSVYSAPATKQVTGNPNAPVIIEFEASRAQP
jgi:hypothetical protein